MSKEEIFLGTVNFRWYCRHLNCQAQQSVASYKTAVILDHDTRRNIVEDLNLSKFL